MQIRAKSQTHPNHQIQNLGASPFRKGGQRGISQNKTQIPILPTPKHIQMAKSKRAQPRCPGSSICCAPIWEVGIHHSALITHHSLFVCIFFFFFRPREKEAKRKRAQSLRRDRQRLAVLFFLNSSRCIGPDTSGTQTDGKTTLHSPDDPSSQASGLDTHHEKLFLQGS